MKKRRRKKAQKGTEKRKKDLMEDEIGGKDKWKTSQEGEGRKGDEMEKKEKMRGDW